MILQTVKLEYHSILNFVDKTLNDPARKTENKDIMSTSTDNNNNKTKNGFHGRHLTFDASTEFDNYQQLFDHETRELLQSYIFNHFHFILL